MKKIILLLFVLSILVLSGCSNKLEQDMTMSADKEAEAREQIEIEDEKEKSIEKVPVEDLVEETDDDTCHTTKDCKTGYCVFNKCETQRPNYPVADWVKMYDARTNNQVRLSEEGFYVLKNGELYYIIAKVDNKRNPFIIAAESGKHFGSKGLNENNRRDFRNKPREAVYTSTDIYKVRISNYESNHEYPFFFNVLASPRDKFDITFYAEDFRDDSLRSEEFEFPIFIVS